MTGLPSFKTRTPRRKKLVRLTIFALASFIVLGEIAFNVVYIYQMTRPARRTVCCGTPANWSLDYEELRVTSRDGTTIVGWYIPPQNGAVILLLHGFGGDRLNLADQGRFLTQAGYGLVMLDLRGHGESGGKYRDWGWKDTQDIAAIVEYIRQHPDVEHIGILGHSYGGQIAMRSAAEISAIEAVIADGPGTATADDVRPLVGRDPAAAFIYVNMKINDWASALVFGWSIPDSVIKSLPRLEGRPLLLIVGGSEPPEEDFGRIYYNAAREPKTLWVIPEARHGQTWVVRPDEYADRVISFFDAAFMQPPSS
jgi:pimeloyl-ACP methyl ester carboxylesterase